MSGPALVIRIELEERVVVYVDSETLEQKQRLEFWLNSSAEVGELANRAIELANRERAA